MQLGKEYTCFYQRAHLDNGSVVHILLCVLCVYLEDFKGYPLGGTQGPNYPWLKMESLTRELLFLHNVRRRHGNIRGGYSTVHDEITAEKMATTTASLFWGGILKSCLKAVPLPLLLDTKVLLRLHNAAPTGHTVDGILHTFRLISDDLHNHMFQINRGCTRSKQCACK